MMKRLAFMLGIWMSVHSLAVELCAQEPLRKRDSDGVGEPKKMNARNQETFTAKRLNDLALSYFQRGAYADAETLLRQALALREQECASNFADVAVNLNNLAEACRAQGKYEEAEALYKKALIV